MWRCFLDKGTKALLTLLEELQEMSPEEFMELYNEMSVKVAQKQYCEEPIVLDPEYREFHDWSERGYKIKKGSKAKEVGGVKVFHKSQVEKVHFTPKMMNVDYDKEEDDIPF